MMDASSDMVATPWIRQFLGRPTNAVRDALQEAWGNVTPRSLKAFADKLAKLTPVGILRSKHVDGSRDMWLVLSRIHPSANVLRQIANGVDLPETVYVPRPVEWPLLEGRRSDDLVQNFFLRFGGLRQSAPFRAGFFYDFPTWPTEVIPGEFSGLIGSDWENPRALFISDTGDELISNSQGRIGWLLRGTREITEFCDSFADVLSVFSDQLAIHAEPKQGRE
jgi:hypothetical protein